MDLASGSISAVSCRHSRLSCYSMGQFLTNLAFFQPTVYKSLAGSNKFYYVAKDEANAAFWLATLVRKMGPSILPARNFPPCSLKKNFSFRPFWPSLIDQTCLVKVAWFWPHSFLFFFLRFFLQTWSITHTSERTRCPSSVRFHLACFNVKCISYDCSFYFDWKPENPQLCNLQTRLRRKWASKYRDRTEKHP